MKKILLSLLLITLSLPAFARDAKESAFDRVMRTNTLRCGYYVFPPVTYRDPNTQKLSGFTIDMMEEIGKRAGLKIEWAEEYTWSGWTEALLSGRFDTACAPMWPDIPTARVVAYSAPMFYASLFPVVRADDKRFSDTSLEQFNKKEITFAAPEGDAVVSLIQAQFPKATLNLIPPGSDNGSYALQLITKKADVLLWDDNGLYQFNKQNEKKLRAIARQAPVKLQTFSLAVGRNELVLKDFLDNAIADLIRDGTMDRLLRKWEAEPRKTYLRVANPAKVQ